MATMADFGVEEELAAPEEAPVGPPPGPVLVGVDSSDEAEMALEWYVCNFHRADHMGLVIYHIVDLPPNKMLHGHVDVYMGGAQWQQIMDHQKSAAKALEQKYKEKLEKLKVNGRVKTIYYARPGESLVEAAAKEGACLIVMGARGTSTTRRTIIGSVTDYVLKHAHCPVTTYRYKPERRSSLAKEPDSPVRHGSFSKLFARLEKPRSRSNSFEVRDGQQRKSRTSSLAGSREGSRPSSRSGTPTRSGHSTPTDALEGLSFKRTNNQ